MNALVSSVQFSPIPPCGSDGNESACSARNLGLILGWGRSLGEGNGYPFQYSYLENPINRGAWGLQSMGRKDLDMTEHV